MAKFRQEMGLKRSLIACIFDYSQPRPVVSLMEVGFEVAVMG